MVRLLIFALSLLALPLAASGQSRTVSRGDPVRVELNLPPGSFPRPIWIAGTVAAATTDSLVVREDVMGSFLLRGFAADEIGSIRVAIPRTSGEGMIRGFWMGPLVFAGVGALTLGLAGDGGDEQLTASERIMSGAALGLIVGIPVGTLYGALSPGTAWVSGRLPRSEVVMNGSTR